MNSEADKNFGDNVELMIRDEHIHIAFIHGDIRHSIAITRAGIWVDIRFTENRGEVEFGGSMNIIREYPGGETTFNCLLVCCESHETKFSSSFRTTEEEFQNIYNCARYIKDVYLK